MKEIESIIKNFSIKKLKFQSQMVLPMGVGKNNVSSQCTDKSTFLMPFFGDIILCLLSILQSRTLVIKHPIKHYMKPLHR